MTYYTLPPTQHHSFFRNLPPLLLGYGWTCLEQCVVIIHSHVQCFFSGFSFFKIFSFYVITFNPLHPNISMHILRTVLYTFPKMLIRRICITIKGFLSWWSFPLFSRSQMNDSEVLLLGETRCWSHFGF